MRQTFADSESLQWARERRAKSRTLRARARVLPPSAAVHARADGRSPPLRAADYLRGRAARLRVSLWLRIRTAVKITRCFGEALQIAPCFSGLAALTVPPVRRVYSRRGVHGMRIALISDLHGSEFALNAVLA